MEIRLTEWDKSNILETLERDVMAAMRTWVGETLVGGPTNGPAQEAAETRLLAYAVAYCLVESVGTHE